MVAVMKRAPDVGGASSLPCLGLLYAGVCCNGGMAGEETCGGWRLLDAAARVGGVHIGGLLGCPPFI